MDKTMDGSFGIEFECLGFCTNPVFLSTEKGFVLIGTVDTRRYDPEFLANESFKGKDLTNATVVAEYLRQYAQKGVCITNKFRAG